MSIKRAYCSTCKSQKPFEVTTPNHILHLLLSVCTFGFWLLVWIPLMMFGGRANCTACGSQEAGCLPNMLKVMGVLAVIVALAVLGNLLSGPR